MFQASRPPIVEPTALERASALQHSFEPSPRELRAQMVQRLQVGLFGLALMLLIQIKPVPWIESLSQFDSMDGFICETAASAETALCANRAI